MNSIFSGSHYTDYTRDEPWLLYVWLFNPSVRPKSESKIFKDKYRIRLAIF